MEVKVDAGTMRKNQGLLASGYSIFSVGAQEKENRISHPFA